MNQETIPDNQDESFSMKHNVTLDKKNTKDIVPYFNLGEYYKERLINKIDLNSLSSKDKIRWDNYYTNDLINLINKNRENKYNIRNSFNETSSFKKYELIDLNHFNDLIYSLYVDKNHIKYLEEVSGLKIKILKQKFNEYAINCYGPKQYAPIHVDTHDLVVIITLKKDSESNSTYYIDEIDEDISDLFKEEYPNFKKIKKKSKLIKCKEREAILFRGGMFPHFTLPHDDERIVIVLNYNIDKN